MEKQGVETEHIESGMDMIMRKITTLEEQLERLEKKLRQIEQTLSWMYEEQRRQKNCSHA